MSTIDLSLRDEVNQAGVERRASMLATNPAYIPRNHQVQAVIEAAVERADYLPFERLLDAVSSPYTEHLGLEQYLVPATPKQRVTETFCGT